MLYGLLEPGEDVELLHPCSLEPWDSRSCVEMDGPTSHYWNVYLDNCNHTLQLADAEAQLDELDLITNGERWTPEPRSLKGGFTRSPRIELIMLVFIVVMQGLGLALTRLSSVWKQWPRAHVRSLSYIRSWELEWQK